MYERFMQLLNDAKSSAAEVSRSTGIPQSTFSDWKRGKSSPKTDKLQKISDYFGVPVKFFTNAPPFDAWENIKNDRTKLVHEMLITPDTLENLTGKRDVEFLSLADFIKFVDLSISSVKFAPNGYPDVQTKPGIEIQGTAKNLFSKAAESQNRIHPVSKPIPVLGVIRAGAPILAEEHIIGYEFADVSHPEEYFFLQVTGDSMINAGILPGSKVLIHQQNYADDGQIVACMVNGDEATLKRFKRKGDVILLMPENSSYEPIIVSYKEFETGYAKILGVAKKVLSDL